MENKYISTTKMNEVIKYAWFLSGGIWGWFCGIFEPAFPLIIIATLFILWDAFSAYRLDVRVHKKYPDKTKRSEAKFVSWKLAKVIPAMTERYLLILIMFLTQKYVFVDIYVPLSYIAAGVIAAEQFWSICENNSSCREEGEKYTKLWMVMGKVFADKTARHFDIDISGLEEEKESELNLRERRGYEG